MRARSTRSRQPGELEVPERSPRPARPTLDDVAAAAGVSRATAARALGDYGRVNAATRAEVRAVASRLGYRANRVARSMVTGRTHSLGFVSADMENPFFARNMRGITDVARSAGYEVVIANSEESPDLERRAVRVLHERRVDGLIVAPTEYDNADHLVTMLDEGVPVVLLDRAVRGVAADAVLVDNVSAARAGVESLIRLGHRRIGLLVTDLGEADLIRKLEEVALDPTHAATAAARGVGYLAALTGAGIAPDPALIRSAQYTRESAAQAADSLLRRRNPPTAILTVDNVLTLGAFEAIQASGLAFPAEVSLLGFDDLEWTTIVRPRLSVIAQPAYDIGATAARLLLGRLAGQSSPPRVMFLETSLIERDSTAPPRARQP